MTPRERAVWLPVLAALVAVAPLLSSTRLPYAADLSFYYWPVHVWACRTAAAGRSLAWDPFVGLGQPALAEPMRHLGFPPVMLARWLLPEVLGFSLLVATPLVVCAAGAYRLLRRLTSPRAAAVGATLLTLSGPVVSTLRYVNLSWSFALLPWVLAAAVDTRRRPGPAAVVWLAVVVALEALAADPVLLATSLALGAGVVVAEHPDQPRGTRAAVARAAAGAVAGLMLAAFQLAPFLESVARSSRVGAGVPELLALHPVALAELVARPLFSDPLAGWRDPEPWRRALNGGQAPLFASVYLGPGLLALAALGAAAPRSRRLRWGLVGLAAAAVLAALGSHAPVLPWAEAAVPVLRALRYPSRHLLVGVLAVAALAALGHERLESAARSGHASPGLRRLGGALLGVSVATLVAALPLWTGHGGPWAEWARQLALGLAVPGDASRAASLLVAAAASAVPMAAGVGAVTGGALLAIATGHVPRAPVALAIGLAIELWAQGAALNPTLPATVLGEPAWIVATRADPEERTYVAGRLSFVTGLPDIDDVPRRPDAFPPATPALAVAAAYETAFATFPSAWGLREAVSVDLPAQRPAEFQAALRRFAAATAEERTRFLARCSVRYHLTPRPPADARRLLARLPQFPPVGLFEASPPRPRIGVVGAFRVESDVRRAIEGLFADRLDAEEPVRLVHPPPPAAGVAGPPGEPAAEVLADEPTRVQVRARLGAGGGFVLVRDSWDPGWTASVDGADAPVLRADGLFRAVRVAPGTHDVVVEYAPRSRRWGLGASLAAGLGLIGLALAGRHRD